MELKQIQDLIKFVAKSGVDEVEMEKGNFKITIKANRESEHTGHESTHPQYILAQPGMMQAQQGSMPQTQQPQPAPAPAENKESAPAEAAPQSAPAANSVEIKAPMIGTFYRSPSPDKDPFVKVGDSVSKGQVVCIVEAMKLFNEIESEVSGKIVKILVDDNAPVEYDQPLFLVEPE